MNTLDEMIRYEFESIIGFKDNSTKSQLVSIPPNNWEVKADKNLDDSRNFTNDEGNNLIGAEEKAGIIEKVLLMINFIFKVRLILLPTYTPLFTTL